LWLSEIHKVSEVQKHRGMMMMNAETGFGNFGGDGDQIMGRFTPCGQ